MTIVRDIDHTPALRRALAGLAAREAVVGVTDASGQARHTSGSTAAEVAAYIEYGTRTQPARPFLRGADAGLVGLDVDIASSLDSSASTAGLESAAGELRDAARRACPVDEGVVRDAIVAEVRGA